MKRWTTLCLSLAVVAGLSGAAVIPAQAQDSVVCPQASVVQNVAEVLQANPEAGDTYIARMISIFTDCPERSGDIFSAVLAAGNAEQIRGVGRAAAIAAIQLAGTDPDIAAAIEEDVASADNALLEEAFREESQTGQIEPGTGPTIPIIAPLTTGQVNDDPSPRIIRGN